MMLLSCTAVISEQSVIVSVEFHDLMDQLANITKPVPLIAFHLFLEGLISKESLAEICSSIEPVGLPLEEIKLMIVTDKHKHSDFIEILKLYSDTTIVARKLEGIIFQNALSNVSYHLCAGVMLHAELEVVAEESFEITGDQKLTFDRKSEYGFKLEVPGGALLKKEGCVVRVRVCLPRVAPVGLDLVSAVYELTTPGSDQHPLRAVNIEIEHCALTESEDDLKQLRFLTSKGVDGSSPLYFHPIQGTRGKFSQHNCYGKLTLYDFSSYGACGSRSRYSAKVYIANESLTKRAIHFVLFKSITTHARVCKVSNHLIIYCYVYAGCC